jgi:hypothetical protein
MGQLTWVSALKLSTMWGFIDIRDLAIQELLKIDMEATVMVVLGKVYGVESLVLRGYVELAKRTESISTEEGQRLGMDTVIKLYEVREAGIKASFVKTKTFYKRTTEQYNYDNHIRLSLASQLAEASVPQAPVDPTIPSSQRLDDGPLASTASKPVRNGKFYMESIVFLVSLIFQLGRFDKACSLLLGRRLPVQSATSLL